MYKNRLTEIKVTVEHEEGNISYEALCYVTINSNYEIEDARISIVEAFKDGDPIEMEIKVQTLIQIEALAGAKAIERVQAADFDKECGRD